MNNASSYPLINWDSPEDMFLPPPKDLQYLCDSSDAWYECARAAPILVVPVRIKHVLDRGKDGRMEIVRRRPDLIQRALEQPMVIETFEYMDEMDHWKTTFYTEIDDDDKTPHRFLAVVLNLANPPGQHECDYHYLRTIHPIDGRNIIKADGSVHPRRRRA